MSTQAKRQREFAKQDDRRLKDLKRAARKAEQRAARPSGGAGSVTPEK